MNQLNLRKAFRKIKDEMKEIRQRQRASNIECTEKIEAGMQDWKKELTQSTEEISDSLDNLDTSIVSLKESMIANKEFTQVIEKIHSRLDGVNDRLNSVSKESKRASEQVNLYGAKLQELEDQSVDIEEVEHSFLTKEQVLTLIRKESVTQKELKGLKRNINKINKVSMELKSSKGTFASKRESERIQEQLVELKSQVILRNDLEDTQNRIESVEANLKSRLKKYDEIYDELEQEIATVIGLKKDFATKEQMENVRKEIKLILVALKEIDRIKKKIARKDVFRKAKGSKVDFLADSN